MPLCPASAAPHVRIAALALMLCCACAPTSFAQTAPSGAASDAAARMPAPPLAAPRTSAVPAGGRVATPAGAGDPRPRLAAALELQRRHDDAGAIAALQALITDYPELPEPYNDLAVVYASQGRYTQAREQLLMALHANPAYATASANLGDVELRLAEQAYRRTLQADGDPTAQAHARAMLRELQRAGADASPTPSRP